jgi:hypothetical protein
MHLLLVDQKNVGTHAHGEESPNELEGGNGFDSEMPSLPFCK